MVAILAACGFFAYTFAALKRGKVTAMLDFERATRPIGFWVGIAANLGVSAMGLILGFWILAR